MKRKLIVAHVLLSLILSLGAVHAGAAVGWTGIRDGTFYFRVSKHCCTGGSAVSWAPAWIADSQRERIYFQAPNGDLIARKDIARTNTSGGFDITFERGTGDYRLEIPGYSFRYYGLDAPESLPVVFEPVKVHLSMSVLSGQAVYFQVPAGKAFTLCGKYHQGVSALHIEPVGGAGRTSLELQQYPVYSQFDRRTIAARPEPEVWRLWFEGRGKVGFWLDGIPNLFAQRPEQLFSPRFIPGTVNATVDKNVIGDAPRIGTYFEFVAPPQAQLEVAGLTRPEASTFYFFEDVLERNINHDLDILKTYENDLGIKDYLSILSWTTRDSISADIYKSLEFTRRYLSHHRGQHGLNIPYVTLVDEPNLRYASYEDFERDFVVMAEGLKHANDPSISSTGIAAPESSRMVNGPALDDAEEHIGLAWAERLLSSHWDLIDAISWHEWLVRDLIATDWYHDSIEQVWRAMAAQAPVNAPLKKLMIPQTNISSGRDLSPYEQDTFFAGLWWTSVMAQATTTGKLAMLNWFKAVDSPPYNKGFMSFNEGEGYVLKPIGHAMAFIHPAILDYALSIQDNSVEVDMAATMDRSGRRLNLFGVNKAKRYQVVNVIVNKPREWRGTTFKWRATSMDASLVRKPLAIKGAPTRGGVRLSYRLAPKSLWIIEFG